MSLNVKVYKSPRDGIKKTNLQKVHAVPPAGLTTICAPTGAGKTNLLCSLLNEQLPNYFDIIYVFRLSPCPMLTDVCDIDIKNVFTDDDPTKIEKIITAQKKFIETSGFKEAPHILVLLDDCAQSRTFFSHKIMDELAFAGTHSKISTWITTQNYVSIPKRIRKNVHSCILMSGLTASEIGRFVEEHQSPYLKKKEFTDMVLHAVRDPYSFIFYDRTNPEKKKAYRKGFQTILSIE